MAFHARGVRSILHIKYLRYACFVISLFEEAKIHATFLRVTNLGKSALLPPSFGISTLCLGSLGARWGGYAVIASTECPDMVVRLVSKIYLVTYVEKISLGWNPIDLNQFIIDSETHLKACWWFKVLECHFHLIKSFNSWSIKLL